MEEVWRDITMSSSNHEIPTISPLSLHLHRPNLNKTTSSSIRGAIVQDFLAGARPLPRPNPHPATALSLNSGPHHLNSNSISNTTTHVHNDTMVGPPCPAALISICANKRAFEHQLHEALGIADGDDGGGDNRQKRMIKNRESAARSRARKQAYTNELQLEVARLMKENAKLKRQYEELKTAMDAQASTKRTLQRTSTAPF